MFIKAIQFASYLIILVLGLCGYFVDTYLNVEYVRGASGSTDLTDGVVLTTIAIAAMSSIALASSVVSWHAGRRILAVLCLIGLVAATYWSSQVSLARIAQAIDYQTRSVASHNKKIELLEAKIADLTKKADEEGKRDYCGPICNGWIKDKNAAVDELARMGVAKERASGATQINYFFPSLSEKALTMGLPLAAVIALVLFMNSFVALGFGGIISILAPKREEKKQPVAEKQPKQPRRRRNRRKQKVQQEVKQPAPTQTQKVPEVVDYTHPILTTIAKEGEISIGNLAQAVGNSHPYVSNYTSELERRGIVNRVKRGRRTIVSMT